MYSDAITHKFRFYEDFWRGRGPCPILFARPHLAKERNYHTYDLVEQHQDVQKLLHESLLTVAPHLDLIDDGIPTIRADLGTTLLPSGLGLEITVQPNQHPWLAQHLSVEHLLQLPQPFGPEHLARNEVALAQTFYQHVAQGQRVGRIRPEIVSYAPDTQGVFDLSHLLIGTDLLLLLRDDPERVHRVQQQSLAVFLAGTWLFKRQLGEAATAMVHGHGMPAGVWFPDTGARISEDSCTLISGKMIREFCLPYIQQAIAPFGRGFLHFCGRHAEFLRLVCEQEIISTLNLGNPELYDLEELFALLGRTQTVYFGHFDVQAGEDGDAYLERLAGDCRRYGARLILVSGYQPADQDEKARLVARWHRLTQPWSSSGLG